MFNVMKSRDSLKKNYFSNIVEEVNLDDFLSKICEIENLWIKDFNVIEYFDKSTGFTCILIKDVARLSPYGFDLKGTLESGQCFRWKKVGENRYFGIVRSHAVYVSLIDNAHLLIENSNADDFTNLWYKYFDLKTDLAPIIKAVDKDPFLHKSVLFSGGVRMLNQDFEETLFSYILSAQNNIPRIKGLVESLCVKYGEKIYISQFKGEKGTTAPQLVKKNLDTAGVALEATASEFSDILLGYSFPTAAVLSKNFCNEGHGNCAANNLCGHPFAGYRCPYIKKTANLLVHNLVKLDFEELASVPAKQARTGLCQFPGVGEKVADCVLLYSGIRQDICPIDTWVEKTIRSNYLNENATKNEIRAFTESYFGKNAGYAQLWFFNYARNGK